MLSLIWGTTIEDWMIIFAFVSVTAWAIYYQHQYYKVRWGQKWVDAFQTECALHEDTRRNLYAANKAIGLAIDQTKKEFRGKLEKIVCTEGCDKGVILLSEHGTFHDETYTDKDGVERKVSTYDNMYFSPLGDALIELYHLAGGQGTDGSEVDQPNQEHKDNKES